MTPLIRAVTDKTRKDLIHEQIVTLVNIVVQQPPAPERTVGQVGYCEPCSITTAFRPGQRRLEKELAQVKEICRTALEDLQGPRHIMMTEALGEQQLALAEFQKHEGLLQFLPKVMAGVPIWNLSWVAWREDDGSVITEMESWINESVLDRAACIRVRERIGRVEDVIWRLEE